VDEASQRAMTLLPKIKEPTTITKKEAAKTAPAATSRAGQYRWRSFSGWQRTISSTALLNNSETITAPTHPTSTAHSVKLQPKTMANDTTMAAAKK
jgi:hypothetical protein